VTKHSPDCHHAFGRRTPGCPRCDELATGAAPRRGWNHNGRLYVYPPPVAIAAIQAHDCKASGCGVVCTFGDY